MVIDIEMKIPTKQLLEIVDVFHFENVAWNLSSSYDIASVWQYLKSHILYRESLRHKKVKITTKWRLFQIMNS